MRPKVYIETSIISYLTARPSNDLRATANQNATLDWWDNQRLKFDLVISEFVIAEASLGDTTPLNGDWMHLQRYLNWKRRKISEYWVKL